MNVSETNINVETNEISSFNNINDYLYDATNKNTSEANRSTPGSARCSICGKKFIVIDPKIDVCTKCLSDFSNFSD